MKKFLTFNDVLINPGFSDIESRGDIDLKHSFLGIENKLPIINANMDTIASPEMVAAMAKSGAIGALHRFNTVERNITDLKQSLVLQTKQNILLQRPFVTLGVSDEELERALALYEAGTTRFIIDVAHGATMATVRQYDRLREKIKEYGIIVVGNFANAKTIETFNEKSKSSKKMDAAKVGIGGGSMCSTRIVTGCGVPTLGSVIDSVNSGIPIIADGGFKTSGDICKALAAGAKAVMLGGMLAGTDETPGEIEYKEVIDSVMIFVPKDEPVENAYKTPIYKKIPVSKKYRGSASKESYEAQGKTANHRTPEGESTMVPYKGPVSDVLQQIEAGIRSSMAYVGARNYDEFREKAELVEITSAGYTESTPHGK